jgi:hypothetical protein
MYIKVNGDGQEEIHTVEGISPLPHYKKRVRRLL